jgi:hypothetical protein
LSSAVLPAASSVPSTSNRARRATRLRRAAIDRLEPRMMLAGDVVISEIMAQNTHSLPDENGDFSDWIELHNTGPAPVNLEGWHLTDEKLVPDKWTFPAVTINPDGYLVVFASQKDRALAGQPLHPNFKLDADGEYLALVPPGDGAEPATEYDPFPQQRADVSFGSGAASRTTTTLLASAKDARYLVPADGGLGNDWVGPAFDDSAWPAGPTGIGYEITAGVQKPLPEEAEPNDATTNANDATANFSPLLAGANATVVYHLGIRGAIGVGADLDFYNVGSLQAGDRLTVSESGSASGRGTLGDTFVELWRANGGAPQLVIGDSTTDDGGPGLDSLIHRFTVTANDTYYVKARAYDAAGGTGTYQLGLFLEDSPGTEAPLTGGTRAAETESNNTVATANDASTSWRPVQYRSGTSGTIEPASDADTIKFRFTANDLVTITADSTSTLDAQVSLLNSVGTVVASEDGTSYTAEDADGAFDSRIVSFVVPSTGNYFVRVRSAAGTGTYRLQVDLSTNTAPPAAAWFSGLVGTNVQQAMRGVNSTAYVRVPFNVTSDSVLADIDRLALAMKYDDGFVAYLNGTEVARRNAPGDAGTAPAFDATATASRDNATAASFESIDITAFKNLLVVGTNVLAVHGLNASAGDDDFLVLPEIRAVTPLQATPPGYFTTPTPGRANGAIDALGVVTDTNFDHDRGFYDAPFDLVISSATPGATIRYTLNGDPPTVNSGTVYTAPIHVDHTTTIRAIAYKPGWVSTNVDTQTYLFLDDVIRQSPNGQVPAGWPASWGSNVRDYGMDPDVVNNIAYRDTIEDDLKTIPTFSLVMDLDDLFNPQTGIYANPSQDGRAWERPASLELINPDGTKGFQADAGIRVRGGFSRSTANPKHGFRFFFRNEYGQGNLNFPLFGPDGAKSFDGFDLRTFQNYSWSFQGDSRGIFMRDVLSRDLQLAMGQPAERGDYFHLYINGQYWGIYNTDERPEANYGASYFGGKPEDYDVIKVDPDIGYSVEATDGNMDAWSQIWNLIRTGPVNDALYQRLQGNNPDGTPNPTLPVLLDMDNLIDYCLVAIYGGNLDAPVSAFLGDNRPNNFFAVRNRNLDARQGFRFFIHDAEHTLLDVNQDRTGPFAAGNDLNTSNPHYFFQRLWASPDFKLRVADHIQKHMLDPGGVLTPAKVREAFLRRKDEIDRAVVAESARWGDSKVPTPLTRNVNWLNEVNRILNSYIPTRTGIVLNQLRGDQLYPTVSPPVFSRRGGTVPAGFRLTLTRPANAPVGSFLYYTLDGSDPRLPGGAVNPNALVYTDPLTIDAGVTVRARMRSATTWSAIAEGTFSIDSIPLRVTEVMYHPQSPEPAPVPDPNNTLVSDDFEYVELQNVGPDTLDLSGIRFTKGIDFVFPDGTSLAPGEYVLVVRNLDAFTERYGEAAAAKVAGVFTGGLNDAQDHIVLAAAGPGEGGSGGPALLDFEYSDSWEPSTDGDGRSLVFRDPAGAAPEAWAEPTAWRRSAADGGSPGAADPALPTTVAGRWLFYNRSGYDGTATVADSSDDNALADDKVALLPGQGPATFANYTGTPKGINGVFVDLADLPPGVALTAADFEFRIGTSADPSTWTAAPNPSLVGLRRGAGVDGSDRVSLAWPDNSIRNTWLQVTVKANERTGLTAPDVFYFGNLVGETGEGNPAGVARVNEIDVAAANRRQVVLATEPITSNVDMDRDGKVNAIDIAATKLGLGHTLTMISPPGAGQGAAAAAVKSSATAAPLAVFSATPVGAARRESGDAGLLTEGAGDLLG